MQRIDVHHHMLPPAWMAEARRHGSPGRGWIPVLTEWTPARSLENMDRYGIASAIVTLGLPGVWFGDVAQARRLARLSNEYAAEMARAHPGRFGFFATLPLPDVEGSLTELAYALDELGADGVWLLTSYGDCWPGDPRFAPVFDELHRRKAVVYFHPTVPTCCDNLLPDVPSATVEYLFDTTRTVTNLLFSGTLSRCTEIRYIFSHAGGAIPMAAGRIASIARSPQIAPRVPDGAIATLRRLYFEIATSTSATTLGALRTFSPAEHILLGTDYPYVAEIGETVDGLDAAGLDEQLARRINRENALQLFPRFGSGLPA